MPKINRRGKSEIISDLEYVRILNALKSEWMQLVVSIARYTGERWGAILQLKVEDVYADPTRRIPRDWITFRAETRKANPSGERQTRQVPTHQNLMRDLKAYQPPLEGWLFKSDRIPGEHIQFQTAYLNFRSACETVGIRGASTHSTRRTFITQLYERGVGLPTIQATTGHRDLKVLAGYIDGSPEKVRQAIACL